MRDFWIERKEAFRRVSQLGDDGAWFAGVWAHVTGAGGEDAGQPVQGEAPEPRPESPKPEKVRILLLDDRPNRLQVMGLGVARALESLKLEEPEIYHMSVEHGAEMLQPFDFLVMSAERYNEADAATKSLLFRHGHAYRDSHGHGYNRPAGCLILQSLDYFDSRKRPPHFLGNFTTISGDLRHADVWARAVEDYLLPHYEYWQAAFAGDL